MGLLNYAKPPHVSSDTSAPPQQKDQLLPRYQIINDLRICGGFIRKNVLEAMALPAVR